MVFTGATGEHQQHLDLAANYAKIAVAYTQIATVATDDHHTLQEFRASVGAQWTFLSDPGRTVLVCRAGPGVNAMRTPVCELLGIERPIVQAPMAAVPPAGRGGLECRRARHGDADVVSRRPPPMVGTTGEIETLSMWAGQGVALARMSRSAADIVAELTSRL